jgi:superoxide reductase
MFNPEDDENTRRKNMSGIKDLYQSADWKSEKHVPVIEIKAKPARGELFRVVVSVGREVAHPNTTAHHIRWIELYFLPGGAKLPIQIGRAEFTAHGAGADGPDTSSIYTNHESRFSMKTDKPGEILAVSYCNIHGLWENSEKVEL